MREWIDAILSVIGAASLSDEEFESLTIVFYGYDLATYNAILAVLDARETVSSTRDRLRYYFMGAGVEIGESVPAKSNILVGEVL
jgi:hypothetical protein